jgi:hypothetical protein
MEDRRLVEAEATVGGTLFRDVEMILVLGYGDDEKT